MSLKEQPNFPGARGSGCQEWLRSSRLSTRPLAPSSVLRPSLGPLEAGEKQGGSAVGLAQAGQPALRGPLLKLASRF